MFTDKKSTRHSRVVVKDATTRSTGLDQAEGFPSMEKTAQPGLNRLYGRRHIAPLVFGDAAYHALWDFDQRIVPHSRAYRFMLGPHIGYVGLDMLAESMLLGERFSDMLPRELRYLLIADALEQWAQGTEQVVGMRLEWAPPAANEPEPSVTDIESAALFKLYKENNPRGQCGGFIKFDDATVLDQVSESMTALLAPAVPRTLGWLQFPLSFGIGTTRLTLEELKSIEVGDIVSVDERPLSSEGMLVEARIKGNPGIDIIGQVKGFNITVKHWKVQTMTQGNPNAPDSSIEPSAPQAANVPPDHLGGLEVPLRFEIGDLSVSLADLKHLQPGFVFELPQPISHGTVRILAHGNLLGTGYLVAIGDRLGVRVTAFVPSHDE
ncbi:MAG TPA: type III secretion system cytoplasmic ring protein SctQ [Burkholderiaceae bacterium]|nr:type III secretion system cytoplasmic ring protein SctQ [Burkholderiaceae bacterium]